MTPYRDTVGWRDREFNRKGGFREEKERVIPTYFLARRGEGSGRRVEEDCCFQYNQNLHFLLHFCQTILFELGQEMRDKSNPTQTQRVHNSSQMKLWKTVLKPWGEHSAGQQWFLVPKWWLCLFPKGHQSHAGPGHYMRGTKGFLICQGVSSLVFPLAWGHPSKGL